MSVSRRSGNRVTYYGSNSCFSANLRSGHLFNTKYTNINAEIPTVHQGSIFSNLLGKTKKK